MVGAVLDDGSGFGFADTRQVLKAAGVGGVDIDRTTGGGRGCRGWGGRQGCGGPHGANFGRRGGCGGSGRGCSGGFAIAYGDQGAEGGQGGVANAGDVIELVDRFKGPVIGAVLDNRGGFGGTDTWEGFQFGFGGGVDIDHARKGDGRDHQQDCNEPTHVYSLEINRLRALGKFRFEGVENRSGVGAVRGGGHLQKGLGGGQA